MSENQFIPVTLLTPGGGDWERSVKNYQMGTSEEQVLDRRFFTYSHQSDPLSINPGTLEHRTTQLPSEFTHFQDQNNRKCFYFLILLDLRTERSDLDLIVSNIQRTKDAFTEFDFKVRFFPIALINNTSSSNEQESKQALERFCNTLQSGPTDYVGNVVLAGNRPFLSDMQNRQEAKALQEGLLTEYISSILDLCKNYSSTYFPETILQSGPPHNFEFFMLSSYTFRLSLKEAEIYKTRHQLKAIFEPLLVEQLDDAEETFCPDLPETTYEASPFDSIRSKIESFCQMRLPDTPFFSAGSGPEISYLNAPDKNTEHLKDWIRREIDDEEETFLEQFKTTFHDAYRAFAGERDQTFMDDVEQLDEQLNLLLKGSASDHQGSREQTFTRAGLMRVYAALEQVQDRVDNAINELDDDFFILKQESDHISEIWDRVRNQKSKYLSAQQPDSFPGDISELLQQPKTLLVKGTGAGMILSLLVAATGFILGSSIVSWMGIGGIGITCGIGVYLFWISRLWMRNVERELKSIRDEFSELFHQVTGPVNRCETFLRDGITNKYLQNLKSILSRYERSTNLTRKLLSDVIDEKVEPFSESDDLHGDDENILQKSDMDSFLGDIEVNPDDLPDELIERPVRIIKKDPYDVLEEFAEHFHTNNIKQIVFDNNEKYFRKNLEKFFHSLEERVSGAEEEDFWRLLIPVGSSNELEDSWDVAWKNYKKESTEPVQDRANFLGSYISNFEKGYLWEFRATSLAEDQ